MARLWVLGAPDPEMEAIEVLLSDAKETVAYATVNGQRCHPGNAYRSSCEAARGFSGTVYEVECRVDVLHGSATESIDSDANVVTVDHHRPGDPGYGRPPAEFLAASSIGQVLRAMDLPSTPHIAMVAAADHCLGAAYRGECPGIDPAELARFRAAERARNQRRTVDEVMRDINATTAALAAAGLLTLGCDRTVRDMRTCYVCDGRGGACGADETAGYDGPCHCGPRGPWPELPEAATRVGVGYISGPLAGPDGRRKITCSGTAEQVRAFIDFWARSQGLLDVYGDPGRGFAGGYLP